MLFPEWLHVDGNRTQVMSVNNDSHREYPVIDRTAVHDPDAGNRIKRAILAAREDTEVFPHLNNYNSVNQIWDPTVGDMLKDPAKRAALRVQIVQFLTAFRRPTHDDPKKYEWVYPGLSLDLESLPESDDGAYAQFVQELYADMHARNLRLYVNVTVGTGDAELKQLAANTDGLILMNYDEHEASSRTGLSAIWFASSRLSRAKS